MKINDDYRKEAAPERQCQGDIMMIIIYSLAYLRSQLGGNLLRLRLRLRLRLHMSVGFRFLCDRLPFGFVFFFKQELWGAPVI